VDPLGRVTDRTRLGVRTVVLGTVQTTDVRTLYTRLGDWVGLLSLMGTGTMLVAAFLRRGR
jgi:apolipoprotein N-acyltransferase